MLDSSEISDRINIWIEDFLTSLKIRQDQFQFHSVPFGQFRIKFIDSNSIPNLSIPLDPGATMLLNVTLRSLVRILRITVLHGDLHV